MLPALLLALALQAPADALAAPAASPASSTDADPLRGDWPRPSGKRITLASSLTVNAALERIADIAGWSLVLDAGAGGDKELTLRLRDVPVEDAFRAVLSQAGLLAERSGQLITVRSEGILPGLLPPALEREAQRATEDALKAARRALHEHPQDRDEDGDVGGERDRHAAHSDLVITAAEAVRDAVAWRGNVRLGPSARARNVIAFGGKVELGANATSHDAVAFGGTTTLGWGAHLQHDAIAFGGNVEIGPSAEVMHDAISIGGTVLVDPSARVHGSVESIPLPGMPSFPGAFRRNLLPRFPGPLGLFFHAFLTFAVLFVVGLALVMLFPRRLEAVSAALADGPFRSLFAGLFGTLGMVLLAVVLVLTVLGILLLPVWAFLMAAGGLLAVVAFTCYTGRLIPFSRTRRNLVLELAAGTLIYSVLVQIPVLGWLVWVATWLLGFGAVLRTRFGAPSSVLPTIPVPEER